MLDFSRQYQQIRAEILTAIEHVCDTQHFILGQEVHQFETAVASLCGVAYGIGCASGSDALWLAMASAEIDSGDAVLTTPFSFFSTVSSIMRSGARPLLADIDPKTYNLDPAKVATTLQGLPKSTRVRAILPVHLYGQCTDWDAFTGLKSEFDILLIEDAAQAFGAKWKNRPAGSLGDMAAFSFYPTKNLAPTEMQACSPPATRTWPTGRASCVPTACANVIFMKKSDGTAGSILCKPPSYW